MVIQRVLVVRLIGGLWNFNLSNCRAGGSFGNIVNGEISEQVNSEKGGLLLWRKTSVIGNSL